jgi:hypothetical protein
MLATVLVGVGVGVVLPPVSVSPPQAASIKAAPIHANIRNLRINITPRATLVGVRNQ